MKKHLLLAALFIFTLLTLTSLTISPVAASGVKVITEPDGTTYLSTEVEGEDATTSAEYDYDTQYYSNGQYMNLLGTIGIEIPEGFAENVAQLINAVLSFVMVIAALLVLFYLIWGAFDWITSGGDKGKIDGARQKIISAVVGLIVVASAYAILLLAIRFLGFESLDDVFESVRTLDTGQPIIIQEATASAQATSSATTK